MNSLVSPTVDNSAVLAEQNTPIDELVRREIAKLRTQAEADGREMGLIEGRKAGREEATAALLNATQSLHEACSQLAAPLANKERDLATLVTDLAFELARHIIDTEVTASVGSLEKLLTKLIQEAAAERTSGQNILVRLNPADYATITSLSVIEGVNLLADIKISRGGALLEIFNPDGDASDKITWDATLEARTESIHTALGLSRQALQ